MIFQLKRNSSALTQVQLIYFIYFIVSLLNFPVGFGFAPGKFFTWSMQYIKNG